MFFKRVYGKWPRWIGRRWEHVFLACYLQNVRGVAAPCPLRMICVNRPTVYCIDRIVNKAAFIQSVAVDRNLSICLVSHSKGCIDRRRRRAPVFMKLEPARASSDLLEKGRLKRIISFAKK